MRTYLFISECGDSLGIAKKIQESGNKVHYYINEPSYKSISISQEGPTMNLEPLFVGAFYDPAILKSLILLNPDIVILDSSYPASNKVKTEFEKNGIPVYGSSLISESFDKHTGYLLKIMALNGINTGEIPKDSIPITYSVVMNTHGQISSSIYYEYKTLMNDNVGPFAYMGCIGYHEQIEKFDAKFDSFMSAIRKTGFSGKLDIMLNVKEDKLWSSGISFYFNHNIYSLFENISIPVSDFFYRLAMNESMDLSPRSPWTCQINCGVPPFPYQIKVDNVTISIDGVTSINAKHIWIAENTSSGNLMTISSRGNWIREAKRRVYRTLSNLNVPNLMYRTDIGNNAIDVFRQLTSWGWLDLQESELVETFKQPQQKSHQLQV